MDRASAYPRKSAHECIFLNFSLQGLDIAGEVREQAPADLTIAASPETRLKVSFAIKPNERLVYGKKPK